MTDRGIRFVTQFYYLGQGGLGRYERSVFPYLEQRTGARLVTVEPVPIPRLVARAASVAGRDLRALARNYPCRIPDTTPGRLIHLSHPMLALGLLFQRFERVVVTVHDIIPYVQMAAPQGASVEKRGVWERVLYKSALQCLRWAHALIVDSYQTKHDLNKYLRIPESRIEVVPLGVDTQVFRMQQVPRSIYDRFGLNPSQQYVLYVGSQEPRKNLPSLYRAMRQIHKSKPDVRMLVVGSPRSTYSAIHREALLREAGAEDLVYFLGSVSEEDLSLFYNLSRLLVLPSVYEGFGLPVLEAMACGCPVVASNVTAPAEIIGDAGVTVSPFDVNAWSEAIDEVLENELLRTQLIQAALERAQCFSWEATAEATASVYRRVLD